MAASPPRGLNIRQRTPVSARARQAELPPQLVKYVETGETLVAEPCKGLTLDGTPARPLPHPEDRDRHDSHDRRRPGVPGLAERRAAGAGALPSRERRV